MRHTAKQYAKALFESLANADTKDKNDILDNFVRLLAENNALKLYPEIAGHLHKFELEGKGIKPVKVTSAKKLERAEEESLHKIMKLFLKTEIEMIKEVDLRIIGGVVVKAYDLVIDASVKNYLQQLKTNLER